MSHKQNDIWCESLKELRDEKQAKKEQLITNIMSWALIFGFCVLLAHWFVQSL